MGLGGLKMKKVVMRGWLKILWVNLNPPRTAPLPYLATFSYNTWIADCVVQQATLTN